MRLNLATVQKILSENSRCPQCKEEAKGLDIQIDVVSKEIYSFTCENGHKWETVRHCISLIMGAYLTHTAKVPESEQEARDHFENCGWCHGEVESDECVERTSFAQQRSADLRTLYK